MGVLECCGAICVDLHSLSLQKTEDIVLAGCSDIQPYAGHQTAQGATSWKISAPPDV